MAYSKESDDVIVEPTELPDVLLVKPKVFADDRGFFLETFHTEKLAEQGIGATFVQDNWSRSVRGTVRGLHFQNPHAQGKLIRVMAGSIYDVAVDIRRNSPTFGQWVAVDLSAENKLALYVPPGFAHGFCVTSDVTDVVYKCTDYYAPDCDRGILYNDPALGIPWPTDTPLLSDKDTRNPLLGECGFVFD